MQKILIVETNAPDAVDRRKAQNILIDSDYYAAALKANSNNLSIVATEPYRAPLTQADLDSVDGVVFTGSDVSWSVDAPEAAVLRSAGELVLNSGLPVIGSCNGLQLGALLLGGSVGASPKGIEIGLARDIRITPEGRDHPMMSSRADGFCVPCMHRDEVQKLPAAATLIAQNDHSPVQAIVYQANGVDFWGMQYHPELPCQSVADHLQDRASLFSETSILASDLLLAETDKEAAARLGGSLEDLGDKVRTTEIANWLSYIQRLSV